MSYKLYYDDGSAAMGVRTILEDIGVPYELLPASIDRSKPEDPVLLTHNPNGWIPVLLWEHGSFYECGAIVTFLCDRHPEAQLAPAANNPDRFCNSAEDEATVQARAVSRLRELWEVVNTAIGNGQWILGNRLSAVDIYMYMLTTWFSQDHNHPTTDDFLNVARVVGNVTLRPSIRKVFALGDK